MLTQSKTISKLYNVCIYSFSFAIFFLPFSKALVEIFITATILSWFLYRLSVGNFYGNRKSVFIIFGLFIFISLLSAIDSGYPVIAFRGALKLIKFVLMAFIFSELASDSRWFKRMLRFALASYSILIFDCFAQLFIGYDLISGFPYQSGNFRIRLMGPFISYGLLAAFLIAAIPILLALIFHQKSLKDKIVFSVLALASILILYYTHSRSAWIASAVALLIFSFLTRKRMIQITLIVILILAPYVIPNVIPRQALVHFDEFNKEQSLVERYYLWDRAVQVIRAEPLFGCGINTFSKNYLKYDQTGNWRVPNFPVHNGFLQIAAESGLIALGFFMVIILMAIRSGWKVFSSQIGEAHALAAGVLASFIALLCQGFADTTFHNPQSGLLLWLFIGLLISIDQWSRT